MKTIGLKSGYLGKASIISLVFPFESKVAVKTYPGRRWDLVGRAKSKKTEQYPIPVTCGKLRRYYLAYLPFFLVYAGKNKGEQYSVESLRNIKSPFEELEQINVTKLSEIEGFA